MGANAVLLLTVFWLFCCVSSNRSSRVGNSKASGSQPGLRAGNPSVDELTPLPRVLRVGTSGDYAPFSIATGSAAQPAAIASARFEDSSLSGFDIELARAFAREHGVRLQWVPFRWPTLGEEVRAGRFDVAMSGVTWRADRAVDGAMSLSVARGGPCLLGAPEAITSARSIAVNHGGFLERWGKAQWPDRQWRTTTENQSLPLLLARGEVDAILTDSFELLAFRKEGDVSRCFPPEFQKAYWLSPSAVAIWLDPLNRWLRANAGLLSELRIRWLGAEESPACEGLTDLLWRRFALMPHVAAYKREHGLPIHDPRREQQISDAVVAQASAEGLAPEPTRVLFQWLMDEAKRVQERAVAGEAAPLDLQRQLRPTLTRLTGAIVQTLSQGRRERWLAGVHPSCLARLERWVPSPRHSELSELLRSLAQE